MAEIREDRDLLIESQTLIKEVLRHMDKIEAQMVPRTEYTVMVGKLTEAHQDNQEDITKLQKQVDKLQNQVASLMWRLGVGLGSLQVLTLIVSFLLSRG